MSKASEHIVECFMLNWDLFGDDKSTEFLAQFTAEQCGVEPDAVYAALEASPISSRDRA